MSNNEVATIESVRTTLSNEEMEPNDFLTKREKSPVVDSGDTSNYRSLQTSPSRKTYSPCPSSSNGCSEFTNSSQPSPVTGFSIRKCMSLKPYERSLMNASVSKPSPPENIKSTNSDQMRSSLSEFNQLSKTTLSVKNKVSANSPGKYSPDKSFPSTSGNSFMGNQFPNFRNEKINNDNNLGSKNNNHIKHFSSNEENSSFLPSPQMSQAAYQSQFIQYRLLFSYFYNIYQRAAEIQPPTSSLSPSTFEQFISQSPHFPSRASNSKFPPLPNLLPIGQIPYSLDQERNQEKNFQFRSITPKKQIRKRKQNTFTSKNIQNQEEEILEVNNSASREDIPASVNDNSSNLDSSNNTIRDEVYLERRRKNNEAAKKSREKKTERNNINKIRLPFLEEENRQLKQSLKDIKTEILIFLKNNELPKSPNEPS